MIRFLIAVLLLTVSVSTTLAAEPSVQQLKELIILGLQNNLGLKVDKVAIESSHQGVVIEDAAFDAQIFANAGYQQDVVPIEYSSVDTVTDVDTREYSAEAGVSKRFETGLTASATVGTQRVNSSYTALDLDPYSRTYFSIELTQPLLRNYGSEINTTMSQISDNQRRVSTLSYLLQAQSLALTLESAVYQLAGDVEIVALRQQAEVLATDLYEMNRKRYEAGLAPVTELQEAETALASRQLNLSQALELYDLDRKSLNRQLNNHLPVDFDPLPLVPAAEKSVLDQFEIGQLLDEAKRKRLDFKISKIGIESSELSKTYQENQLKPQLDLNMNMGVNGLAGSDSGTNAINSYDGNWLDSFSSLSEAEGYQFGVGVSFTMPLGNEAAKARVRQAEDQSRQETYRLQDLEDQVRDELEQQQVQLQRAYQQLQLAERFASLAQQSLDQEQRKLEEGLSDTFRMISFQDSLIDAQINKINSLTRYRAAQATMAFLRGNIFARHNIGFTEDAQEIRFEDI
jgi:outer membrane protein TolC